MKKWSVHDAFNKAINNYQNAASQSPIINFYEDNDPISIEVWEDILIKAARLVDRWGIEFLPIFERVEHELEKAKQQLHSLEKAKYIARTNLTQTSKYLGDQSNFFEP